MSVGVLPLRGGPARRGVPGPCLRRTVPAARSCSPGNDGRPGQPFRPLEASACRSRGALFEGYVAGLMPMPVPESGSKRGAERTTPLGLIQGLRLSQQRQLPISLQVSVCAERSRRWRSEVGDCGCPGLTQSGPGLAQ